MKFAFRGAQLSVQLLEDRITPAIFTVTNDADDADTPPPTPCGGQ